jgi:HK97 family phage portal protein
MGLIARALGRKALTDYTEGMSYALTGDVFPLPGSLSVTGDAALGISAVYACVRVLAETVASLPLLVYRRLPNGGKERYPDHPLYAVLHDSPNPEMTSFIWRETLMGHECLRGNAYSEITYDQAGRLQLWPLHPDRVVVYWNKDGVRSYDYITVDGIRRELRPGSVFHVPGLSPDGLKGYNPIALHRQALELAGTAQRFGLDFFRNNARPGIVMTHPRNVTEPAAERLTAQMDRLRGAGNNNKTVMLEEGIDFKEVGVAPEDAQYIETRKFQMQEIARIFRVPPHMIGDLERATFSNIEHQSIDFVVHTIRPWLVRIEQEISNQLLINEPDVFAEFLVDGLLRGDSKSRADALATLRQNGIINGDEWRAIENMNPIEDGSGQSYWMPVNMTTTDQPVPPAAPEAPPAPFQEAA